MSSSGATGGDQCNRRRLREQPHLKVMQADTRQKSRGTRQGRPEWRKETGSHTSRQPQWKSILKPTPKYQGIPASADRRGGNKACVPGIEPGHS